MKPSRAATNATLEGANLALEDTNVTLEGANLALEGANLALEGANVALEGANVALEDTNVALEGANITCRVATSSLCRFAALPLQLRRRSADQAPAARSFGADHTGAERQEK